MNILSSFSAIPEPLLFFLLGMSPLVEIHGATALAVSQGKYGMIPFALLGSITAVLLLLALWDILKIEKIGVWIVGKKVEKKLHEFGKNHEKYGWVALVMFIGLTPFPLTGVYTGTLIAKIFGMKKRHIILGCFLGAFLTGITTGLITVGVLNVLGKIFR